MPERGALEPHLCQVGGLNRNYVSSSGTAYHIQIEDRGPVLDRVTETNVRRVNVIVYANYGESNARIVHGRDHDFQDTRTADHNRFVQQQIQALSVTALEVIEEKEARLTERIKALLADYYRTKSDDVKEEFEDLNALYPFVFSRAWKELKEGKLRPPEPTAPSSEPTAVAEAEAPLEEVLYPLDAELRERVLDIERVILELARDLRRLREGGGADDILLQTCRKLVLRARESLTGKVATEFTLRRLDMTRNSLMTTWRQVRSRLVRK